MPITTTLTPAVTIAQFRIDFPEFADSKQYPDSAITYWLAVATLLLNPCRIPPEIIILAAELYIAHNILLEAMDTQTALAGGWPGVNKGVVNSETPGEVTVSYDTAPSVEPDAGHWNLTRYGTRFIRLARMAGAGPVQVGPGCSLPGTLSDANVGTGLAWSGPDCRPGKFGS